MRKRANAIIRYDGPALAGHEMDVQDLAPALLALGDICRIANHVFNGQLAEVQVLVRADVKQKCFQLEIQFLQTIYDSLTTFLEQQSVQDAKNLLEWLGIAGAPFVGLFGLYKWLSKSGRADASSSIEVRGEGGNVIYQTVGGGDLIVVPAEVHRLASDPRMFPAAKRFLTPMRKDGYERFEFEHDARITQYFTREEAEKLVQMPDDAIVVAGTSELVSTIRTAVRIRRPAYEGDAKWTVTYKRAVDVKMDDEEWLRNFQSSRIHAPPGSSLLVDLEERVQVDQSGQQIGEPSYKIKKVLGVIPPTHQMPLFEGADDQSSDHPRSE